MSNRQANSVRLYMFVLLCSAAFGSFADVNLTSTEKRTTLIELYTSEGCSSCPPADRWMSTLKTDPRLWNEIIPVAFHVDYWDYLGWKDRFANSEHSARQRSYERTDAVRSVYTPGFVVDGREWRGWFTSRPLPLAEKPNAGILAAHIDSRKISITYSSRTISTKPMLVNVAWLGFDLSTDVAAGENRHRKLPHDFVVLSFRSFPAPAATEENVTGIVQRWEIDAQRPDAKKIGLAIWVSRDNNPAPVQAVGGWVPF